MFPNEMVHHFHPIAWVKQMRLMLNDDYTIYITRKWEYDSGINKTSATISSFTFGSIKGFIAEPHGEATAERGKDKCIPLGIYKLVWHTSDDFPKDKYGNKGSKKYLKNGFPKLYNKNVSKGRGILIHIGNTGIDSEGCLLPGNKKEIKNGKTIGVSESTSMFFKLIRDIERKGIENIQIIVKNE